MVSKSHLRFLTKKSTFSNAFSNFFSRQFPFSLRSSGKESFSTTVTRLAERNAPPARGTNTLRITKKAPVREKGKPPGIGERKASRKRIVLSNSNALDVNLPGLNKNMIYELVGRATTEKNPPEEKKTQVKEKSKKKGNGPEKADEILQKVREPEKNLMANVVGLSNDTIDSLRALEAFKITQSWGLFRQPGILIREESKILTDRLVQAQEQKINVRLVIDGAKGSGKSMLLLHAMATAFVNDWVVLHIPEAQELVNAASDYAPIPNSELFCQNTFTADFLGKIARANSKVLSTMKVKQNHPSISASLDPTCTIHRLCELGAREPELAWPFFLAFWSEMTSEKSPPVMMCLDGLSYILKYSSYLYPDLSKIHSHDLAIVRHFTDYLSGAKTLPNGGAILAATNRSHAPISPSLELAAARFKCWAENKQTLPADPYQKYYDSRSDRVLENVEFLNLGGLSKNETRGLLEYWAKSGVFRSRVDEKTVAEKWVLAGHGNAGEIQRGALWMRI